jgi:tetratricopeptide (TPR) repeat protein
MYNCQTPSCSLALSKAIFPIAMNCPVCQIPLSQVIESNEAIISFEDNELLQKLPYVIAYPLQQTLLEKNAPQRLNYLRDTFLNYLKYLGLLTASEFFNSPFKERKIVDLFLQNLAQPSFGSWNAFTRECLLYLKTQNHTFFCPDLMEYYETIETGKKRKMYNGEIEVVDSYNGGETKYIKQTATGIGMLINFRNRYLGHGLTLDSATSEKLWNDYFPIFRTLLEQLTFSERFPMLKQEAAVYYSLQGIEIKPFESNITIDSNVSIYNRDTNSSMPIIPFFIIPGELAIESDEKANIMSYESNNGKTITFFSPEGITKQTSGKLLERLNLLLRDKQKEIPFTPETFTKAIFLERIAEENQLMLKSLLNEKKVIEGIYQHREEMEIKLREWIGARANIFFIAAEAGSGKTNLLVEIQKQYAARNLTSLLIRAARMEKPSLKEELCYQLNMDYSLDIAQYTALAGTQSEPTFILIDGLNESSNAEAIWQEILKISSAFEPGSFKFIITSRANTKTDLDRYGITEDQMQYLYGENKDHETSLGAFAFWLTPLDMKEMESAWKSYVAKDKNRFKPLFSFNDIATFDRGLYLQINNPLVLRIFLETYKGKNLPKKGTKHLHVWKDWLATFSNEEQKFMSLLADAVWEQGENELLLDTVLNNKNLQFYFLNDTTNAPFQRLLTLGWISRYVKDLTVYVSFTVEGLLLYLLGTKLNQQIPLLTTVAIDEILSKGTKLQKSAIESFLCEQALEGHIDLTTQLIDEGNEKVELCVTPLFYFLKSQGVEKMIEKLLKNPTENDWEALIELDVRLANLQFNILRKDFLKELMTHNQLQTKDEVCLGLKAITIFNKDEAIKYLNKVDTNAFFIVKDANLLNLLGKCEKKLGSYDKALEYYEKSLRIRLKTLGDENPNVASSYNNIGNLWNRKGECDKALEYYEKCLDIQLKTLGGEHPHVTISYNNIGNAWGRKYEYDKSLEFHEKSLTIRLKTLGEEHPSVATLYNNIGSTWNRKEECDKALEYYEKSLWIRLKNLGVLHPDVANVYNNIGTAWKRKAEYDKALEHYEKCLIIRLKTLGVGHPEVASSYNNIGDTWKYKNEFEKALEYYEKCLPIELKTLGGKHYDVANRYYTIGNCNYELKSYSLAIDFFKKGYAINKLGGFPFNIAQCYESLNDKKNALDYYIQSAEIRKDDPEVGLEAESTQESISNTVRLAKELGKENELPKWIK